MKQLKHWSLLGMLLAATTAPADTVTGETVDTLPGQVVIGTSGFLLGGFVSGGPAGALLGGGIGWLLGDMSHQATGLGDKAYQVQKPNGEVLIVRSPNRHWSVGDEVSIVGNRLVSATQRDTEGHNSTGR